MANFQNRFKTAFDSYACIGDTIETKEINGITYTARIVFDESYHIDDDDCHTLELAETTEIEEKLLQARQAWFDNEWFYCGIVLSAETTDGWTKDHIVSLWGIECNYPEGDNSYLTDVANELLDEILEDTIEAA